jgi:hypothetical protein
MRLSRRGTAIAWLAALTASAAAQIQAEPRAASPSTVCQQWPGRPECGPYAEKYGTGPQTPWGPNFQKGRQAPTPPVAQPAPTPRGSQPPAAETADCNSSNAQTVVVLRSALDVARCIFTFYNTGYPIAIAKRLDVTTPTCVVLLSGTEPVNFAQATTLPEDIQAAINQPERDLLGLALLDAIFTLRNAGVCRQARLVFAGHSLGGMEAQNAAAYLLRQSPTGLSIGEIITFGSPATADLSQAPPPRRFTTIGDPIPYTTVFTGTYRSVEQITVSDLGGVRRTAAIAKAAFDRYRAIGFSGGLVDLGAALPWLAFGALGPHMQYPNTAELGSYDALGNPSAAGSGAVLRLQTLRRFQAKR